MADKPKVSSSLAEKELDKVEKQFEAFDQNIKDLTHDRMNAAPAPEREPSRLSQAEIEKSKDIYLKPVKAIGSREKFNEDYRKEYEFAKEYVRFEAAHKEIIGETIEMWTKPFAGMPAELWNIPVSKPVWGPRYLAEQITKCRYHRMSMQQSVTTGADHMGQYYGSMVVDTTVQRLDAIPVSNTKSIFMGARGF